MKILAIDTTGAVSSTALIEKDSARARVLAEFAINDGRNHSLSIMPAVARLLETSDHGLAGVDFLACASGPGSFTGLRIGAATVRALAHGLFLATGRPAAIIPVSSLDALAYNIYDTSRIIVPVMDARRGEVYSALYKWCGFRLSRLTEYLNAGLEEVLTLAARQGADAVFTGDGVVPYGAAIRAKGFDTAPEYFLRQRAGAVGMLAAGADPSEYADYRTFLPFYLRKPQAERESAGSSGQVINHE
ncbi:MAG: tRNA (adenosine(37)-N6)-threonylcarbamoyltransferase complex dimerization subunit type 1 TsaB [Clostridiales bacterium]|jgi:tRNA threonylcarbamoyladenosine biosynthesis protein TsaB|nr:tRNA (adenosine(37)-N6)-threonylcarbamoyltransferase complex dimerization subunit type 1 TsaB [Clostridiales bacterium]